MKKDYTKIVFVVDRSGSMASIAKDIIGGYNKFIADQRALKHGICDVSFYQFDTEYETVYENTPIDFVKDLDDKTFVPRGGTALLDAVGQTISKVGKQLSDLSEDQRPEKVLIVVITDGEENSSRTYHREKVKQMVTHQTDVYKWSFTYIGANQDAWNTGGAMGFAATSNLTWANNITGSNNIFSSLNNATSLYRTSAVSSSFSYTLDDVKLQAAAGAAIDMEKARQIFQQTVTTTPTVGATS
jgi:uncharacterized protein YegL